MFDSYIPRYHVTIVRDELSSRMYNFNIVPVFLLLEKTPDGRPLVIPQDKWKYICLIPISVYHIDKLCHEGAYYRESSNLYSLYDDARIQLAYICSKLLIPFDEIELASSGILNAREYKSLVKYMYEEFPEKYI